ncbi:hypothetical protein [Propionicimonas sp.]|uniref:hypothetical protein n=1 Tax=Propionicimonas sp. TaxID=1955623 RepID=UPI0039E4466A
MAEPQVPPQREPDPGRPPSLESKDWLGAGGSVLAIALSVLGLNREPAFRAWAVGLMLLAAGTGMAAILIPRYRRVTTAAAVLLVVASVGVLTLAPEPTAPVAAASPSPGPHLSLGQVDVVAPDGGGSVATLDITVRNDGSELAVLTGVELTIDGFGYLPPCLSGSNLEVTGKYSASLPDDPRPGQVVRVTLHQQVEPGAADRFTVGLRAPATHGGVEAPISSYLYLMRVAVVQDAAGSVVAAGEVLVDAGSPLDTNGTFYFGVPRDATALDVGTEGLCGGETSCVRAQVACWNANRATLLPLLAVPATRSEGGNAAAAALDVG